MRRDRPVVAPDIVARLARPVNPLADRWRAWRIGADIGPATGGEVALIELVPGRSSTGLVDRLAGAPKLS